jgi:hypothetical protein
MRQAWVNAFMHNSRDCSGLFSLSHKGIAIKVVSFNGNIKLPWLNGPRIYADRRDSHIVPDELALHSVGTVTQHHFH